MSKIQNEKGYALLLVMLMVVLFTLLGMGLLAMNMNAAKQFNTKEEQVQARHQAEMGVLHYKNELESYVKDNSSEENIFCYDLPSTFTGASGSENYSYEVKLDPHNSCFYNEKDELVVKIISTGTILKSNVTKTINAEIRLSNNGSIVDDEYLSVPGKMKVPQKPSYPEEWEKKQAVSTFDDIDINMPSKVVHGITSKEPLVVNKFVEIIGSLDINKKSTWTFDDHFIVAGSMATSTAGKNVSEITIGKDLYIGGALHIKNHTIVNVYGDFMVMGDVNFGTKTILTVKGNALFDYKISNIDTHSEILIEKDAYFKSPLDRVKNNASFCVKGQPYLWKKTLSKEIPYAWLPYKESDPGYDELDANCIGTSNDSWRMLPEIDATYM